MTSADIYWLAGWLEGEGTFGIKKNGSPYINSGCKDKDIVERFASITGNHTSVYLHSGGIWYYQLGGARAIQWMMTLYPLMGERRKLKIKYCIDCWKSKQEYTPKRNRIGDKCKKGHIIIKDNIQIRYDAEGFKLYTCKICSIGNRNIAIKQKLLRKQEMYADKEQSTIQFDAGSSSRELEEKGRPVEGSSERIH